MTNAHETGPEPNLARSHNATRPEEPQYNTVTKGKMKKKTHSERYHHSFLERSHMTNAHDTGRRAAFLVQNAT